MSKTYILNTEPYANTLTTNNKFYIMNKTLNNNPQTIDEIMDAPYKGKAVYETDNKLGEAFRSTKSCERLLLDWVEKEFKHSIKLKGDGANNLNNSEFCLRAASMLIANHSESTFSEEDFHKACSPFPAMDYQFKHEFFDRFTTMLLENNRCVIIHGVYDFPVYRLR